MIQEQQNPNQTQEVQIVDISTALVDALGIAHEAGQAAQETNVDPSAIQTFLSKLFRKHSQQSKKFHEVKLSRLNAFLYKVCKKPPTQNTDFEIISQTILLFINSQPTSSLSEGKYFGVQGSFGFNTGVWIARCLEQILSIKLPEKCLQILQVILKQKKLSLMSPEDFQKCLSASQYFKSNQLTKNDEIIANQMNTFKGFMGEFFICEEIKTHLKPSDLFQNLYKYHPSKTEVIKCFISYTREGEIHDYRQLFTRIFIAREVHDKDSLNVLLECLDTELFTTEDFNIIVRELMSNNDRKLFYSLNIKELKCHNRYVEILAEDIKPNLIEELVKIFISEKEANNYYMIYLIHKSAQKLPETYLALPLDRPVTNRQAIICALCINQNIQIAHKKILQFFFENESKMSSKQKLDYLKITHFSYINVPKSQLFTSVIKSVPFTMLDREADFQFLPKDGAFEKIQLDKDERQKLHDFSNRYFGNSDQVYWLKLDLYSICGKQLPCMQDFKKVQKIFQSPIDQILQDLPNIPDTLLEVVLMGINNRLSDQFAVSQTTNGAILQWTLDLYKKQLKKYKIFVQAALKKTNNFHLLQLCLDVFDFNLDQRTQIQVTDELKNITSAQNKHKLNGLHFSQYFMGAEPEKNDSDPTVIKNKVLVIQLQKLIKNLSSDTKAQNKKEIKTLMSEESTPLRALKIIKSFSSIPYQKIKNADKLQAVTQVLLSYIKPEQQNFKQLSQKASNVNIPYVSIFESLQFLLRVNYEKSINFIAQFLSSKSQKTDEKPERAKKSGKKKADHSAEKKLEGLVENIQFCFNGDPNSLSSYNSIISIIEYVESISHNENLSEEITKWVSKIKIFYHEEYKHWRQKVLNYIKLWESISGIVGNSISLQEVERHFLILINLLNTLYQKHKQQKDFLSVQKKLLNGLHILFILANNIQGEQMQQEQEFVVPKQKLNQAILNQQPNEIAVPHIYYCYDCSKKVCHQCATIIHRNHDKNYIGNGNQSECHRFGAKPRQSEKTKLAKQKYIQKFMREGGGGLDALQRQRQKILIITQAAERLPADQFARFKQEKLSLLRRNQRLSTLLAHTELQEADFEEEKKREDPDELQKFQIRSCSQKQFSMKNPTFISEEKKPKPTFENSVSVNRSKKSKLNLTPLFNLLVREIKSNSLYTSPETQADQKNSASIFEAEMSNEKYTLFKVDNFRNNAPRVSASYLLNQQQNPNAMLMTRRNTIGINEKLLMVLSGGYTNQLHYLDTSTIRARFIKKQTQKRYKQNDTIDTYQINHNKLNQPSILQINASPYVHNLIAEMSSHKIVFEQVSKDVRNKFICAQQTKHEIVKFQWLRSHGLKSFHAYLAGDLFIGKIGKRDLQLKHRITIGDKKIRDFSNCMLASKIIVLTILDTEGKLYRSKFDPYGQKKPSNFSDFKINFVNPDLILSICTYGNWVLCTTTTGKLTVLTFNQENNLVNLPVHYPIIEQLKTHKISQINMNFKEVSKIGKLKYITKHQNQIFVSCLLMKENSADGRKGGYFVIICLNLQTKKAKLVLYNDQGTTDSYDFIMISEKQFLFVCLQDDGEMWACKLTAQPKNPLSRLNQTNLSMPLQPQDLSFYAEHISRLKVFQEIEFYNKERKKSSFKENLKITDHFKNTTTLNSIGFDMMEKFIRTQFVTGIEFGYNHNPDTDGLVSPLVFSFMGNVYRFDVTRAREIQIPLTIKQSLTLFFGLEEFKIKFVEGKPQTYVRDIAIFGVKTSQKSVYSEALNNVCEMLCIYNPPKQYNNDKRLEKYFYNENRTDLNLIEPKPLEDYFTKKKFTLEQQNLLLKLELLRESVQKYKSDGNLVFECFQSIRSHILPNCSERKQLISSVYKLCQALTQSCQDINALKLGHPLNYETQMDIYNAFRIYKIFTTQATVDSFQDLLNIICKIFNNRTLNGIIIMAVYPTIFDEICKFFRKLLSDYKIYFKTNDYGLEKDEKQKLNRICNNFMRILMEQYQFQKNILKNNKTTSENYIISTLESIFCLQKKEVHKEIKLNPFQFLQSPFQERKYLIKNPPFNYLEIHAIDLEQPKKEIDPSLIAEDPERKIKLENNPNQQSPAAQIPNAQQLAGSNDMEDSQSFEEHKQQEEENREMLQEYQYEMVPEGGLNGEKQIQQDDQESENDANTDQSTKNLELDTKKIYDYLYNECQRIIPQEVQYSYYGICQNILIQLFSGKNNTSNGQHKYLNHINLVFYVGLAYNLLQIVDKKISSIFGNSQAIDFSHPYIQSSIVPIIQAIDERIDSPAHSVFYLSINSLIAANPKSKTNPNSAFVTCLLNYYRLNLKNSKLLECLLTSKWYPEEYKQPASISSVLRFEYFDTINQIYQVKYVGNLYLNMIKNQPNELLESKESEIKENILKAIVRFNLRVYQNIMVMKGWTGELQKIKINVAFEKLQSRPEESLKIIIKSISKDAKAFIQDTNQNQGRITALESLLGTSSTLDELILQILNSYYSYESN